MSRDVAIEIWRGANDPGVTWGFDQAVGVPADLSGSVFDLVVVWPAQGAGGLAPIVPAGSIAHSSAVDGGGDGVLIVDLVTGDVTWPITIAESEAIPRTGARYELFRSIVGRRRPWCGGAITVRSHLP